MDDKQSNRSAAWKHFIKAEYESLARRKKGHLRRLLGTPLQGESYQELEKWTLEDQVRAEQGLVEFRSNNQIYFKHIDELTPEDIQARAQAESFRAKWLASRHLQRMKERPIERTHARHLQAEREVALSGEQLERAKAEERQKISRELHDRVAPNMGLIHQSLELYKAFKEHDPQKALEKLELAQRLARETIESVRDLSIALRTSEVKESLKESLSKLLEEIIPDEIEQELRIQGEERLLTPRIRDQLFLVLREAVRNAVSYSRAQKVTVEVYLNEQKVVGCVEDNGQGFNPERVERESGGLVYMAERASLLNGTCLISTGAGKGTRVEVCFPLL